MWQNLIMASVVVVSNSPGTEPGQAAMAFWLLGAAEAHGEHYKHAIAGAYGDLARQLFRDCHWKLLPDIWQFNAAAASEGTEAQHS